MAFGCLVGPFRDMADAQVPEARADEGMILSGILRCMRNDSVASELRKILSLVLTEGGWAEVEEVLDEVEVAISADDEAAAVAVVKQLAVYGDTRTRIGDRPTVAVPEPIRERVDRLVHELGERARLAEEPAGRVHRDGDH